MNSCAVRIFEPHTLGGAAEMAGVEVVDLTLSDDEEDVAVGNRDEEVVEVVVNREVRGAGPANRADDDEDEVVVTGAILGTPFPFLRRDASTSDARVRVKGAPLRYESVLGPFRSCEPGTTRDDFLAHAPLKPSDLTHLVNLFFTPPRVQEWSETTPWSTSPTHVTLAPCSSSTLRDTRSTARTAGASPARDASFSDESNKNPSAFPKGVPALFLKFHL